MNEHSIQFFYEDVSYVLRNKTKIRSWLAGCAIRNQKKIASLNFIFCSDLFLKKINLQYLNHNYFTDIITFPTSSPREKNISGDIYISIDRVKENAGTYGVRISEELHRVMVHGLLHLCGYKDKTSKDQLAMRKQEDACLAKFHVK